MNKESANSMLKFLEEPDGNVIGFFILPNNFISSNNLFLLLDKKQY